MSEVDVFGWEGFDNRTGAKVKRNTAAPATETTAAVLEHLRSAFPNVTITDIKRLQPHEVTWPPKGVIEPHQYQHGILEAVYAELGLGPAMDQLREMSEDMAKGKTPPIVSLPRGAISIRQSHRPIRKQTV